PWNSLRTFPFGLSWPWSRDRSWKRRCVSNPGPTQNHSHRFPPSSHAVLPLPPRKSHTVVSCLPAFLRFAPAGRQETTVCDFLGGRGSTASDEEIGRAHV